MDNILREAKMKIEANQYVNVLKEAVEKDDKLNWEEDFVGKARDNPFYRHIMKEAILKDVSGALGVVHDVVVEAAKKMAVASDIIWTIPVTQPTVRFYKAQRGQVWRVDQGPPTRSSERFVTKDISVKYEYGGDALFGQSYLEDCPFPVLQRALADMAQRLEEKLTSDIIALYDGIAPANLAGGAVVNSATSGSLAWTDFVNASRTLKLAGWSTGNKVAIVHPYEMADIWLDDKFIRSDYWGGKANPEKGVFNFSPFGATIVETDLMALDGGGGNGNYAYLINLDVAAVCLMRRNKLTQPYEEKLMSGAISTSRYGLGTLREDAVCRIDIVHA